MTINGIFFDLYGTLLVYGNMDTAWSDWLKALHAQLRLRGLTRSIESLAKTCDQLAHVKSKCYFFEVVLGCVVWIFRYNLS